MDAVGRGERYRLVQVRVLVGVEHAPDLVVGGALPLALELLVRRLAATAASTSKTRCPWKALSSRRRGPDGASGRSPGSAPRSPRPRRRRAASVSPPPRSPSACPEVPATILLARQRGAGDTLELPLGDGGRRAIPARTGSDGRLPPLSSAPGRSADQPGRPAMILLGEPDLVAAQGVLMPTVAHQRHVVRVEDRAVHQGIAFARLEEPDEHVDQIGMEARVPSWCRGKEDKLPSAKTVTITAKDKRKPDVHQGPERLVAGRQLDVALGGIRA